MPIEQYTYWSITINNPDDNDRLIIRTPNEKYIRSFVFTPEIGEEGTTHIQGWVRFQRNQSMSFVKKLYPRAHVKPCAKDEYNENCYRYAQKDDETTAGNHHIILNDPLPANDTLLYKVLEKSIEELINSNSEWDAIYTKHAEDMVFHDKFTLNKLKTSDIERSMVMEKSGLEKIFCSPAYEKMKTKFYREIIYRILKTQNEDANNSATTSTGGLGIANDGIQEEGTNCEDNEECSSETDEGHSEGTGSETDENSDF